ncbi:MULTISPECIES: helix-turn-helix transcriptional regulator [Clostridium]|uniref:helix-turn-helix transcriptional regulator n=1 Tax=Clostridium TaxID=1485 RepID=UPI0008250E2D|nr:MULTISPECIES: helix-turn-helix transcriptional regulator [Clostridium]PJI08385.1 XRE family transcriptional regulator [Clostridium sp. CT7]
MASYEILSIGDKLKNLREKYNVRQDDIAGGDITRNLISQIEHGKANLTRNAAEIILKNLKKICVQKHIKVDESIEYLMEDEKSQANKILDDYIKELKDLSVYKDGSFTEKLTEVEGFLTNWNLVDKKIVIFELAGDYFSNANDFYNSSLYYEKAKALMDVNVYTEDLVSILRKLSMIYSYMDKYEENIKCCDFALNQFGDKLSEQYRSIFLFNSSLCYSGLKKYNIALDRLKKLEPIIKGTNTDKYCEVLGQEGFCLGMLEKHNEALDVFSRILKLVSEDNLELRVLVMFNLVDAYINLGNIDMAKQYLEKIAQTIDKVPHTAKSIPYLYREVGKIHKKLNEIVTAKSYYLKSLDYAKTYKQYNIVRSVLNDLFDIYIIDNDDKSINEVKDMFLLNVGNEQKVDVQLMNKLFEYYLNQKDYETLKEIQKFIKLYMKGRGYNVI